MSDAPASNPQPSPNGGASDAPVFPLPATDDGKEELIFQGPVSLWIGWQSLACAGLAAVFGLAALVYGCLYAQGLISQVLIISGGALAAAAS